MRDFAIFRGEYLGCELKTGAGCGKFNNQRERDFLFLWGWHARIVRESSGMREFSFVLTNNLLKLRIYGNHICELRSEEINEGRIIAVVYATFAVAKRKPEKNSGL